ncbi:MAG: protein translocase subunit SecF [Candidatus Tagabacteria bacterium CG09_land_8_20_14_0_10_41_14]|uniref:Protein-export membrane protein SecF n=1 Tax=Candidatus Tagabacteria bacterium CG09_land_8_20_14_0_10_41_14 TaxID=1975021 RepID=A0A2H0WP67_9BACT|nr:MAG: protein translocase subunit SecF [Candidatus Tagabacteria bacterium CG09_land_8_20_14_0_10_41_14]
MGNMIKHRKIFYIISGALVLFSLVVFIALGLNPAIDFTGGSFLEVEYTNGRPEMDEIKRVIETLDLGAVVYQPTGDAGLILRMKDITESQHQQLLALLGDVEQKRFDSIGPVIGRELTRKAWLAIIFVILMIVIFITWAFRKVSRPVQSWKYGLIAIAALVHDVAIPVGVFSVLGHFFHVEVDILFITALLTILGFSIHDTIVVFDRVRENLKKGVGNDFEDSVVQSLKQVRGRSVKTSLAIILVLVSFLIFGGVTTKYFTITLIMGIVFGTYSSLFLASPLLVTWYNWQERRK